MLQDLTVYFFKRNVDYSTPCGNLLLDRLSGLEVDEIRSLLHKYFIRVLDLRMEGCQHFTLGK